MATTASEKPAPDEVALTLTAHARLQTRQGVSLDLTTATASDEGEIITFFTRVRPEDVRFRFGASTDAMDGAQVAAMCRPTLDLSTLVARTSNGEIAAIATLAFDAGGTTAEVAIVVADGWRDHGIGWTLLAHIEAVARSRGATTLCSLESMSNVAAVGVEKDRGFAVRRLADDPADVELVKRIVGAE
jgi:acetyltransferase